MNASPQPRPPSPMVVIAGPTASGKSHLALQLAQAFGGEIVNYDSVQLYRGFDIGTAKTPLDERAGIPHHLLDVLDPQIVFSAGDFAKIARSTVAEISSRRRLPILVGGTGFYLQAFLGGLPLLPPRDPKLRERIAQREARSPGTLRKLLTRLAPEAAARIDPADIQKQMRALEIRILTGGQLPSPATSPPLEGYRVLQLGLAPDRQALVERIRLRTQAMFRPVAHTSIIDEVRSLLESGLTGGEKPFEAIGYKQALQHLRGELTLAAAQESTEIETRQYAKRQRTWFRRDERIEWLTDSSHGSGYGFGNEPTVVKTAMTIVGRFLV